MKLVNEKELEAISFAVNFFQFYVDYYEGVELCEGNNINEVKEAINVLVGILKKENFKANTITKTVTKNIEVCPKDIDDKISLAFRKGSESVPPLFNYCIFNTSLQGDMYVTDNLEVAMNKAKCLSLLDKFGFYEVCSIRKIKDGTYKLFRECCYHNGIYHNGNDEEFLHFDYIRKNFTNIIKL